MIFSLSSSLKNPTSKRIKIAEIVRFTDGEGIKRFIAFLKLEYVHYFM